MEQLTSEQVYRVLQNLSGFEMSFSDYSRSSPNYNEYRTYIDYLSSNAIRSHDLGRFYFHLSLDPNDSNIPKYVTDLGEIPEALVFLPSCDITVSKLFNFPSPIFHQNDYYTMYYILDGSGKITVVDRDFGLQAGDIFFIPPHTGHAIATQPESICICINLRTSYLAAEYGNHFQNSAIIHEFLSNSLDADTDVSYLAIHTSNSAPIRSLALDLFAEYINQLKYCNIAMKSYYSLLMTEVLRDSSTQIESSEAIGHREECSAEIMGYLQESFQTASLGDASEKLHYSKQYICRIIKSTTGKTFQTLLTEIRLKHVKDYLVETKLPIETIAQLCGFATPAHLSRTFKSCFGMPPSEFRAKQ